VAQIWCPLIHGKESLAFPSLYISLYPVVSSPDTGAGAKAWCLLIHVEATLSFLYGPSTSRGGARRTPGECTHTATLPC